MMKIKNFFLIMLLILNTIIFAIDKKVDNIQVEKTSPDFLVTDLVNYYRHYSNKGSIIIIGKDMPFIDHKKTYKLAEKQVKEVKKYFRYWLDYWSIKVKTLDFNIKINDSALEKEIFRITFISSQLNQLSGENHEKIEEIVKIMKNKKGLLSVESNRTFSFDLNTFFKDTEKPNLDFSDSLFLDSLFNILKIYGDGTYVRLEVDKKPIFKLGKKKSQINSFLKNFTELMFKQGLKENNIFLFPQESVDVAKKEIELYFLPEIISESEAISFLEKLDILS